MLCFLDDFANFPSALLALDALNTCSGSPFAQLHWFELLHQFGWKTPHPRLRLLQAHQDNNQSLIWPFYESTVASFPGFPRILRALSNYYSGIYQPYCLNMKPQQIVAKTAQSFQQLAQSFDAILLHPITETTLIQQIVSACPQWYPWWENTTLNWYETGITGFDAYWQARPTQLRHQVQRKQRKADLAGTRYFITKEQPLDSYMASLPLSEAIHHFTHIYNRRWQSQEPQKEFIPEFCRRMHLCGWLRLCLLQIDQKMVATQIWLQKDGTLYLFKSAYCPQAASFSPGTLLMHAVLHHVLRHEKIHTIDFLGGEDTYKSMWLKQVRPQQSLWLLNRKRYKGVAMLAYKMLQKKYHQAEMGLLRRTEPR